MAGKEKNTSSDFELPIPQVLSIIFVVAIIIFLASIAFDAINKARSQEIYSQFEQETILYMQKNTSGLHQLFVDMQNAECSSGYNYCKGIKQNEIMNVLSDDLKDFSSTVFVAPHKNGKLIIMRLSGERELVDDQYPNNESLRKLIDGKVKKLVWDDYTHVLNGKEIVIPFKNSNGEVIGLLLRAVIGR